MGWKFGVCIGAIVVLVGSTGYLAFAYTGKSSDLTEANSTIDGYIAEVADLEQDVTDLTDDLSAMTGERDTLEDEKADLENELDDADSEISSLQSSLSAKTAELSSEKARTTSLQGELNKVMYPRHFSSVQELRDWLQQDDTDDIDESPAELAFILQVRALQDGYILCAWAYVNSYGYPDGFCDAYIEGQDYMIWPEDDYFELYDSIGTYLPTYPIPQGQ
jgi:vacuolar-type H+-ATPase subunit I/STV1